MLASELQACREEARESGQKVSKLLEKERRLEETCRAQAQRIGQLEAVNQEVTEGSRELAVRLRVREVREDGLGLLGDSWRLAGCPRLPFATQRGTRRRPSLSLSSRCKVAKSGPPERVERRPGLCPSVG